MVEELSELDISNLRQNCSKFGKINFAGNTSPSRNAARLAHRSTFSVRNTWLYRRYIVDHIGDFQNEKKALRRKRAVFWRCGVIGVMDT